MASVIRSLLRGGADGPRDGVVQHTVGNALVLHARDKISAEAQSLALTVIEDAENDVVVLDLGEGMPIGSWESMAGVLPRRRRGIRLMACGDHRNAAAMAGQWLSERLNRTVIAPDGDLIRGAAGGLFVHSMPGSGWVRFRPGKPPTWDAKRYPTPVWDRAVTDQRPSSSTGEIEPLPGGVWLHDTREPEIVAEHRKRLVADVPCQPEVMTVLLGCPGTPPLSLDDVVRFWRGLDTDSRTRTRFVQYGDIRLPEGEAFGQALADLLGVGVVCYTGVPVGSPDKFEIRTVRDDGVLGWPPFALELGYAPRAHSNSKARRPVVLSHREPLAGPEEIAPRIYWYAPDAVVEVVETGLWVRPAEEPQNAERVRATPLDPQGSTLIFDDTVPEGTARMRELAEDLAARVGPSVGQETALFPASVLVPGQKPAGRAEASLRAAEPQRAPAPAPVVPTAVEAPATPATTAYQPPAVESVVVEPVAPWQAKTRAYTRAELFPAQAEPVVARAEPVVARAEPAPASASAPAPAPVKPAPASVKPVEQVAPPAPAPVELAAPASPAPVEPVAPAARVEPVAPIEPVAIEPVAVEPVAVEPVAIEPVAVEPVAPPPPVEPVLVEPAAPVQPVVPLPPVARAEPIATEIDVPVPAGTITSALTFAPVTPAVPVEEAVTPAENAPEEAVAQVPAQAPAEVPPPPPAVEVAAAVEITAPSAPAPAVEIAEPVAAVEIPAPAAKVEIPEPVAPTGPVAPVEQAEPPAPVEQAEPSAPVKQAERKPAAAARTQLQPVPAPAASALLPRKRSLDEERAWLRRTLSREFDTMASSVARIMSEHPGLQSSGGVSADDVLADSVAVQLYLSGRGAAIDKGLRTGATGPHVPFARCAVSGLSRLPSFRGTTVYRTSPTEAEWAHYRDRRLITDWSFVNVLTGPCEAQEGDTDVLVWSMTARRTTLLEPEGDDRVTDRVLFLPGTHFKVLELREPSGDGRGAILMREIGSNEVDQDGRVDSGRVSLDELAVTSLRRSLERWADAEPRRRIGSDALGRFGVLPGLDRRLGDKAEVSGR